ncbi:MAG: transporter substrate-binding protein [Acidimicrobiaceae bacterium]|nr:transporter substrate-binding protein [Acidimicrobiaceae bacterium]
MVRTSWKKSLRGKVGVIVGAGLLAGSFGGTAVAAGVKASKPSAKTQSATFSPPHLGGLNMSVIMDGTASASNEIEMHAINLLSKWGAKVSVHWAPSTSIEYADMLHGGTIMEGGLSVGLAAYNDGIPMEAIALPQPRQDFVLIARPNITSLSDLKGHSIGILDMVGENGVDTLIALKAAALKPSQVSIVDVGGQSTRLAALVSGRIDVTMLSHSAEIALQGQGYHVLYDYMKQDPNLYDGIWWANPSWAKSHEQAAVALNEADLLSFVWFNNKSNTAAAVKETASFDSGISASQTTQLYNELRTLDAYPNGSLLTPSGLKQQEIQYAQVGAITATPVVSNWSALSYGKKALAALGAAAR